MKWTFTLFIALLFALSGYSQAIKFDPSAFRVSGNAVLTGNQCFRLTEAVNWQGGSVWYKTPISLNEPFEMEMDLVFGCQDFGADGIVFIFHPELTTGFRGEGMGFGGLFPALGIEMDTYYNDHLSDPTYDHIAIMKNGSVHHGRGLTHPVAALPSKRDIEDCKKHRVKLTWQPSAISLKVFFDGNQRVDFKYDIVKNIFHGNASVYWGFSAATGGFNNKHEVCLEKLEFEEVAVFEKETEKNLLEGETYSLKDVEFSSGSAQLQSKAKKELDKLATLLKANKEFNININGHTDNTGNAENNKQLSQKRADAVTNYLIEKGVNRKRITTNGYGEQFPKKSNNTSSGRKENRRVDVYLSKPRA